jgi:hypothetical protein
MLLPVPRLMMIPQEFPRMLWIGHSPSDRIEFMIPHDATSRSRLHDPLH